jgi:hypothetical protein
MKIRCPKCHHPCKLFTRVCEKCGLPWTVSALWGVAVKRIRKATAIECPDCRQGALPFGTSVCPVCGAAPTFRDTVRAACAPFCFRVQDYFEAVPPQAKWLAQWLLLLVSAAWLWWTLGEVVRQTGGHWFGAVALSVIHLTVIGFLTVWLVPRSLVFAISRRATGKVKLALALNFFAGMVLLQLVIKVWWDRTTLLAAIFVVLWLAAWLLHGFVLPQAWLFHDALLGGRDHYDSAAPQGRSARFD